MIENEEQDDGLEELIQALIEYGISDSDVQEVVEKLLDTGKTADELLANLDSDEVADILADYDTDAALDPDQVEAEAIEDDIQEGIGNEDEVAADIDVDGDGSADTSVPVAGDPVDALIDMFDALTPEQQDEVRELIATNPALDEPENAGSDFQEPNSSDLSNPLAKLISQLKY